MAKLYVLTVWKGVVDSRVSYSFMVEEIEDKDLHRHCSRNSFIGVQKTIPTEEGEPRIIRKKAEVYEIWTDRGLAVKRGETLVKERERLTG